MALGPLEWKEAREKLQRLLSEDEPTLRDNSELREKYVYLVEIKLWWRHNRKNKHCCQSGEKKRTALS